MTGREKDAFTRSKVLWSELRGSKIHMMGNSNPLRMGLYLKIGSLKSQLQLNEAIWVGPESNVTNRGPHPNGVLIRRDRDTEDGSKGQVRAQRKQPPTGQEERVIDCFGHLSLSV